MSHFGVARIIHLSGAASLCSSGLRYVDAIPRLDLTRCHDGRVDAQIAATELHQGAHDVGIARESVKPMSGHRAPRAGGLDPQFGTADRYRRAQPGLLGEGVF